jgi:hypothetical protein
LSNTPFWNDRAVSTYDANVYSLQEMNNFPCQMFWAHRQSPTGAELLRRLDRRLLDQENEAALRLLA